MKQRVTQALRRCCIFCEGGGTEEIACAECRCHTGRSWPIALVAVGMVLIVLSGAGAGWVVIAS